jgi:hypothetical protein
LLSPTEFLALDPKTNDPLAPAPPAVALQWQLPRRESVAEGAARRTLHDGLGALEADFAIARRGDVEIGLAYQQRAEFGLAQFAEELGEAAARHVDVQRLLVVAQNLDFDIPPGDLTASTSRARPA